MMESNRACENCPNIDHCSIDPTLYSVCISERSKQHISPDMKGFVEPDIRLGWQIIDTNGRRQWKKKEVVE